MAIAVTGKLQFIIIPFTQLSYFRSLSLIFFQPYILLICLFLRTAWQGVYAPLVKLPSLLFLFVLHTCMINNGLPDQISHIKVILWYCVLITWLYESYILTLANDHVTTSMSGRRLNSASFTVFILTSYVVFLWILSRRTHAGHHVSPFFGGSHHLWAGK